MLTKEQLCYQVTMPEWCEISLKLYKEFSVECLFSKTFRYYLENDVVIDVEFKEWAMKHLWAIHHINSKIDKNRLFKEIDKGLEFTDFRCSAVMKKRLNDHKDRIRMFACIYQIMKTGMTFYVENGKLMESEVRVDYIKSKRIDEKGVHIGLRYEDNVYVPVTILVDRAINPTKSIEGLQEIKVQKLEILENKKIIETIQ